MGMFAIEGNLVTEKTVKKGRVEVSLKTGLVTKVGKVTGNADIICGKDELVFPGFGDIHIHAREDETGKQVYKEDYTTAASAALNGGVVHVSAMPNTPNPVVGKQQWDWHRKRITQINHPVSILNYLGIDSTTKPLGKPGQHIYKLYFGKSIGSLTVTYGSELEEILKRYKGHNISFHVEYEPVVQASGAGKTHSQRRPVAAVNEGLRILLPLIEKYKIKAKLCHWSTGGESFKMVAEYRARGCDITLEVSPLHLFFDTSMTDADPSLWTKIQMNPAVQSAEHRKELIKGLKTGFIQFLATDHAPHAEQEKFTAFAKFQNQYPDKTNKEIAQIIKSEDTSLFFATCLENNTSGAPWLDVYGLVCAWLINEQGFKPTDIARVAAFLPGKFVNPHLKRQFPGQNFGRGFGELKPGFVGSFTVLDLSRSIQVARRDLKTKCGWSPFENMVFPGRVKYAIVRGRVLKK